MKTNQKKKNDFLLIYTITFKQREKNLKKEKYSEKQTEKKS